MHSVDDEFFGSDERDNCNEMVNESIAVLDASSGELATRETAAIERQYFAIGYHETFDDSHDASLQHGFNDGYRENYDTAVYLGRLLGHYATSNAIAANKCVKNSEQEKQQQPLNIDFDGHITSSTTSLQRIIESRLEVASRRIRTVLSILSKEYSSRETDGSVAAQSNGGSKEEDSIQGNESVRQQRRIIEELVLDIQNLFEEDSRKGDK
jgi:hypothetical protein